MTAKYRKDPQPPRYEDVNRDGISDMIVQKRDYISGPFWSIATIREEVLYGTGIDLNGKPLFLPKELFEQYQK